MKQLTTRTGNMGNPIFLREAVVLGVKNGWTAKQAAYETGWKTSTLQAYAARMNLSFAYGGMGSAPKYTPKDLTSISAHVKLKYYGKELKTAKTSQGIQAGRRSGSR